MGADGYGQDSSFERNLRQERGDGAIYEIARILDRFNHELRELSLTYNVGLIVGGTTASYDPATATGSAAGKVNVVPAQAQAVGDVRTVTEEQYHRLQWKMRQVVADHLPGTSAEIEFALNVVPAAVAQLRELSPKYQKAAVHE